MADFSDEPVSSAEFTPEQQERIRAHIRARGMSFEVFLPETLADWLRAKLAAGGFENAREAAFVAFQQMEALDRHPEVRQALLKAMVHEGLEEVDSGHYISLEEWKERYRAEMREYANTEPPTNRD